MSASSLKSGVKWDISSSTNLSFGFLSSDTDVPYYFDSGSLKTAYSSFLGTLSGGGYFSSFSSDQKAISRQILGSNTYGSFYSDIVNLTFSEESVSSSTKIIFGQANLIGASAETGLGFLPNGTTRDDGDVFLDASASQNSLLLKGEAGYWNILHELGHAVGGLVDASGVYGTGYENSQQYTVMSYLPIGWEYVGLTNNIQATDNALFESVGNPLYAYGLQLYDIEALQNTYAVNSATRDEDRTVYSLGKGLGRDGDNDGNIDTDDAATAFIYTIYDAGGTGDTIDARQFSTDNSSGAKIDLRAGHFSSIGENGNGGAAFDRSGTRDVNNVAIATRTVIENAYGTTRDDFITGNDADNLIILFQGNDIADGGGGSDTLSYAWSYYLGITQGIEVNISFNSTLSATDVYVTNDGAADADSAINFERVEATRYNDTFHLLSEEFSSPITIIGGKDVGGTGDVLDLSQITKGLNVLENSIEGVENFYFEGFETLIGGQPPF